MAISFSHPLANGCPPPWASAWGQDRYGPWAALCVGVVEQRLRWLPPGRFWMGSPEEDHEAFEHEKPRHLVQLTRGFWLFETPCTQAFWHAVMGENPSQFRGEQRPVESVSWEDCQRFLLKLNEVFPDLQAHLPTEAQWEYACRAGTETPRYAEDVDAIAWYDKNSKGQTRPVKQKQPNAWGLYDMLGNVWEWCHDGRRSYSSASVVDPLGSTTAGAHRAIRGGLWYVDARYVRAARRDAHPPGLRDRYLGFRCAGSGAQQG